MYRNQNIWQERIKRRKKLLNTNKFNAKHSLTKIKPGIKKIFLCLFSRMTKIILRKLKQAKLSTVQLYKILLYVLVHCKKRLAVFPFPAGMSLPFNPFNYSRPGRVWLVASRLGTGKSLTFFLHCMP